MEAEKDKLCIRNGGVVMRKLKTLIRLAFPILKWNVYSDNGKNYIMLYRTGLRNMHWCICIEVAGYTITTNRKVLKRDKEKEEALRTSSNKCDRI